MSKKQQGKVTAVSAEAVKKHSSRVKRRETFHLDMMVLPGFLVLLIFNYLPMIGLVIAFKDYNPNLGIMDSPWNGLENFRFFFESQDAVRTIRNTVMYSEYAQSADCKSHVESYAQFDRWCGMLDYCRWCPSYRSLL